MVAGIGDESMSCPKHPTTADQIGATQAEVSGEGIGTGAFYKLYPDLEKPVVKTSNRTGCWVRGNFFTFPTTITSSTSTLRCTVEGMLWHFKGGLPECLGCFSVGDHFLPDQSSFSLKTGKVCSCNCNERMDQHCLAALLDEGVHLPEEESDGESIMVERAEVPGNFRRSVVVNSHETNASSKGESRKSIQNLTFGDTINEEANLRGKTTEKANYEAVASRFVPTKHNPEQEDEEPRMNMKTGCTVAGTFYTFPFSTFGSFCRCTEHGMLWCWKGGVPSCLGCLIDGLHFSPSSSYTVASGTVCTCTCSQQMEQECLEGPLDSKPWKGMAWHIE